MPIVTYDYRKANLLEEAKDIHGAIDDLHASLMNLTRDLAQTGASLNDLGRELEDNPLLDREWTKTRKVFQKASDQLQYSVWDVFHGLESKFK